jgi:two-component system, NarL family, sensor histidine kinase UhpB
MRQSVHFLWVFFSAFCFQIGESQNQRELDSLLNEMKNVREDTVQAELLNHLASYYTFSDPQKSFEYSSKVLILSQKLNAKKQIVQSYQNLSTYYAGAGKFDTARAYIMKSIPLIEELGNKIYLGDAYGNLSNVAYYMNDYAGAFSYSEKALQLAIDMKDSTKIAWWLNTMGLNHRDITADYNEALNFLFRALTINRERGIKGGMGSDLYSIGSIYFLTRNVDKALEYTDEALRVSKEVNDVQRMGESLSQLGDIYFFKKDFIKAQEYYTEALHSTENTYFFGPGIQSNSGLAKINLESGKFEVALEYLNKALQIAEQTGDKGAVGSVYGHFSDAFMRVKNYQTANEYLLKNLAIGKETGKLDLQKDTYHKLADNNQRWGNYKAAYAYLVDYIKLNDSIVGEQVLKKTAELQVRFETEKKEKEIALLNKDKEVSRVEIKKQKVLKNAFIGGLALLALLTVFVFNTFRTRNKLRLQSIRNRIADDLHDDIGSTLNSISVYSEVAKQKSPTVVQELEQIGEASRKIIDAMSDIVWTINTKNDSFEQIILRLRSLTYNLLRAKNIEHTFRADENLNSMKLSMEQRRNFYLIFKEALNNLVKYSNASRVSISLTLENNFILLTIHDNGIGFDTNTTYTGNGLLSMKNRAEEMKAELKIESELGSGTYIRLKLKA